ncbi:hypothetical protein FRC08_009579 [Ceratobasidium sp. 394]|nr:hypothetical protein FRC08_009579 [Ceratobasidium sp. 394]
MVTGTTKFTRRTGTHVFRRATPTNGYSSLVNNWHKNVYHQQDVVYNFVNTGTDNVPNWEATPTIMGEEHPQYTGHGTSKPRAQEDSARQIANSGHCPVLTTHSIVNSRDVSFL